MGTRKNPFEQIGYQAAIPRMPTALKHAAIEHEKSRQRVVASILLELHMMTTAGLIQEKQLIRLSKAISQNLKGSKEETTQAAHCAPRQVLIGVESMQELMHRVFPERAFAISIMFGEADILPANYNKCDSLAEKKGLEESFRRACQYAVGFGDEPGEMEAHAILTRAETAYAIYKNGATVTFRECMQYVKNKFKPFLFPAQLQELNEQYQILEQYADTLRDSPGKSEGISMNKIVGLIKIYKMPLHL
jgi:hypothetical protein